jgi:predicted Zn-dependent protease
MSDLFERLIAINRFGRRPPEFLLSHPVTESRIADARSRVFRYPNREYKDNFEYQFARARVEARYAEDKKAYVEERINRLENSKGEFEKTSNAYGLVMALWGNKQYKDAHTVLEPLLLKDPNRISLAVTQSEILTSQNESRQAISFLDRHLQINPGNHALTMAYANALIQNRDYSAASKLIQRHSTSRPDDHQLWYLLAETQGQAGNISEVHQARAEYFRLIGDFRRAREQLQFALRIEIDGDSSPAIAARIREKINGIEDLQLQLQLRN